MKSSIFTDVKERLNLKDVAEYYGVDMNRGGFTSCLFHDEQTPSMKLYDEHFHCFGCGCHGSVIDLTVKLFNILPIEAAQKLAYDFGINTGLRSIPIKENMARHSYNLQEQRTFKILEHYCRFLRECGKRYVPKNPDDTLHPLFLKSSEINEWNYHYENFLCSSRDERKLFMREYEDKLRKIERILSKSKRITSDLSI